jgi:ATP-dependent Lhr-like helicase
MPTSPFHPIVADWFAARFGQPTESQRLGWPEILAGQSTLIAAPTGSGKTLAAFLVCIDRLLRQAIAGELADETQVVYVSPLKALSNDIHRNLEVPLAEIQARAAAAGHLLPELRAALRTGDTPASQRQAMTRRPPHILVTTPESLYLLLTAKRSRETLRKVRTVIVDEIHALARDKRGSHFSLSLERLAALCDQPPVRIGLSATQRPMDEIARFLVGTRYVDAAGQARCRIVDVGHVRELDLAVEVPPSELSAVCSIETWNEVYARLAELIGTHRSTLVFVNTRRLAERVSHHLSETLGEDAVASHHGSLSKETRLSAERRLQSGQLKAIVATASLELGIDVGYIDLVCQISSPRSIATFLQRVGRAGHSLGAVPKGRIFPLTRDNLLEAMALVRAVKQGRLDRIELPKAPLDILAQQIVAAVAADECDEEKLFELCRAAWPYRDLPRADFDAVVRLVSEGIAPGLRRGAYLHHDRINRRLKARRGARIAALTSGGAIPDTADYRVVTDGEGTFVGTVNEDFAIESLPGDVFLLGNTSWRIRNVRSGTVTVADAQGAPATIPFWLGEAPGRTVELSEEISQLRDEIAENAAPTLTRSASEACPVRDSDPSLALRVSDCGVSAWGAEQAAAYVAAQVGAIGLVPTRTKIVFERFFDEAGGMQLVIHAPLGSRINRAWGLALRKRFCRSFNFELQAAADDNGIVLSLGPQHSFPLDAMFQMLSTANGRHLLVQALLAAPMFNVRWRWNATRALAILRQQGGKKVPPPLQRMKADDLLTAVFPTATACLENVVGDIEVPDHPLVRQTVEDCLHEAMDVDRWLELLSDIEAGRVELISRDTREPSPFCYEILNANPYAFLDDAPLEERRARAVATRRSILPQDVRDLARLDPAAIEQVVREAWPLVRDADELHDALLQMVALPEAEGREWAAFFSELVQSGRATIVRRPSDAGGPFWIASERWPVIHAAMPEAVCVPIVHLPAELSAEVDAAAAHIALVRGRIEVAGPVTAAQIAAILGLRESAVSAALEALEGEGCVLRGEFTDLPTSSPEPRTLNPEPSTQWCDRRLLARIHRLTLDAARRQVQPVEPDAFLRFLCQHQHLSAESRLEQRGGLRDVIAQLQGCEIAAGAWERDVLPCRVRNYDPAWLDELALAGEIAWGRLQPPHRAEETLLNIAGVTRVMPISLTQRSDLAWLLPTHRAAAGELARGDAMAVFEVLAGHGALFFDDLLAATGLLPAQLEDALSELAALGAVTSDGFATMRMLVSPELRRRANAGSNGRRKHTARKAYQRGGRWSRFPAVSPKMKPAERNERWAWQLLNRYGVMFRDLLTREDVAPAWGELVPIYRRFEAQGKIRGGRFVSGVAGEQYALPEAVDRLRRVRDEPPSGQCLILSAADPLNLFGVIVPGERVPALASNALAVIDGRLVASLQAGEVRFHETLSLPPDQQMQITRDLRTSGLVRSRDDALQVEQHRLKRWERTPAGARKTTRSLFD